MTSSSRKCVKCGVVKSREEFGTTTQNDEGWPTRCKACINKAKRDYREKTGYKISPEYSRTFALRRKYGLTPERLEELLQEQEGRCVACRVELTPPSRRATPTMLSIDHCHDTGKVRGLLCNHCNLVLGLAKDSPTRLRALADYLENSRQTPD